MRCPSCKFEAVNGINSQTWDGGKYMQHEEYFYTIKGDFRLSRKENSWDSELNEVTLNVCPKCGTVFIEHYWIRD